MSQEERRNLLGCCGFSCSTRRTWENALFIKVTGHGGNGFPSMAARAVLAAALAGLLLFLPPTKTSLGVTSTLAGNTGKRKDAAFPLPCLLDPAQALAVQ